MSALPARLCELGHPGAMRDRLVEAVLHGDKTATSSLLGQWQLEGAPLPVAGERQLLIDSDGKGVAVVEVVDVDIVRLGDVELDVARDEGEGFGSVEEWRTAHEKFWADADFRSSQPRSWRLADDTEVVIERLRVVRRLPV